MMFVVPIIGDAHFRQDVRQMDRLASVDQILEECLTLPVGAWAIPGDLYDAGSDIASRNEWSSRLVTMANVAPVLLCQGNHDRNGDLDIFAKLGAKYPILVFDRPQVVTVLTPTSNGRAIPLHVFVLPYPHASGLVASGTPTGDVVASARTLLDAIFMDAGARLFKVRERGEPTLMIGHANVGGSRLSTGQPLIGHEIELDEALLVRLGDCPKVLNHIHYPQEIGGAVLTGSIAAMSWGETEAKRYVCVNYSFEAGTWAWALSFCPLKTPQLVLVEAVLDQMTFTYDHPPASVSPGSDVRVRVRFQESERQFFEYGRPQVLEAFAHARRLQIEPICLADKGLRSPEVAAAKTLPEKLRAWCAVSWLDVPAHLDGAVANLETKPADQVIAEFRTKMTDLLTDPEG